MANSPGETAAAKPAIPDYLEPMPMFPLGCSNTFNGDDFIMVVEFAEVEGPRPIKLISSNLPSDLDVNILAMKVLPIDHHFNSSRDEFAIAKDVQLMMTDGQLDLAMLVHSFKLYDRAARGYVRPMCITYGSRDYNKMMLFYEELSKLCYEVVAIMEQSNREVFLDDMEHYHADLLRWLSHYRTGITEFDVHQQQAAEAVERALLEASHVIQCFGREPDSEWKCAVQPDVEGDATVADLLSKSSRALLQKPSHLSLYGIDEMCPSVNAAWKLLEVMHKYYSRTTTGIICHRNQYTITEPAAGLLLKGSEPLVNFFLSVEQQDPARGSRDPASGDDASSNDYFYSVGSDAWQCAAVASSADNGSASLGSLSSEYLLVHSVITESKSPLLLSSTDLTSWGSYSSGSEVDGPPFQLGTDWRQRAGSSPVGGGRGSSGAGGASLRVFAAGMIGRALSAPLDSGCGGSLARDECDSSSRWDPEAAASVAVTPTGQTWPGKLLSGRAARGDIAGRSSPLVSRQPTDDSSVDAVMTGSPSSAAGELAANVDRVNIEDLHRRLTSDTATLPTLLAAGHTGSSSSGSSLRLPVEIAVDMQAFLRNNESSAIPGHKLPGVLLRLAMELRPFPVLVHSLLTGRPVVVVADVDVLPKSDDNGANSGFAKFDLVRPLDQQLLAVVRALETLVPGLAAGASACTAAKCVYQPRSALSAASARDRRNQKPGSQHISDARRGPPRTSACGQAVSLVDVCQHKIIAVFREKPHPSGSAGSSGEADFSIAAENVLRHVTVLNLSSRTLRGPLYKGSLSSNLRRVRKEKHLQDVRALQLHLDRVVSSFAMKAFVLYQSFNYYYFRELEPRELHASKQRSLLRSMGLSPDDAEIVLYMASIVDRRQADDYLRQAWGKCGQPCLSGQLSAPWMATNNKACRVYGRRGLLSYFSER